MALKELGKVKTVHDSGMIETDEGHRVNIKASKGDRIQFNTETKKPLIAKGKLDTTIEEGEYAGLDASELTEKFKITELKSIAKQKGLTKYSKLKELELAEYIVSGIHPDDIAGAGDE